MEKKYKLRTLIADDHGMFIDGLKTVLKSDPGVEVVAEAPDGTQAYKNTGKRIKRSQRA